MPRSLVLEGQKGELRREKSRERETEERVLDRSRGSSECAERMAKKTNWVPKPIGNDAMESRVGAACLFQKPCYVLIDAHSSLYLASDIHDPEGKLQQYP